MRRIIAAALMMTLLLCSCTEAANESQQKALDVRTGLLAAGGCQMEAELRADYGEAVYRFSLSCSYTNNGESTVSVTAPELISGVTAVVGDGGAALVFESVSLDTGLLPNTELTPLGALPAFGEAWASGYISNSCMTSYNDVPCLFVSYLTGYGEDELELRTWFESESLQPVYGEIVSEGNVVIYVNFL